MVKVGKQQIEDMRDRLRQADFMPEIPYMVNKELDLDDLDTIFPETWINISDLIKDAVSIMKEKLADTRWAIEPVRVYGINANKFILSNMIGMQEYFGRKLREQKEEEEANVLMLQKLIT